MNKEQTFNILEQALNVANTKGAFVLSDAAIIHTALQTLRLELNIPLPEMETPKIEGDGEQPGEPNKV